MYVNSMLAIQEYLCLTSILQRNALLSSKEGVKFQFDYEKT